MIALNGHPFQPQALQGYVDQATTLVQPGQHGAIIFGLDNSGTKVAIVFTRPVGHGDLAFQAALAHEWSGNNAVGVAASYSF